MDSSTVLVSLSSTPEEDKFLEQIRHNRVSCTYVSAGCCGRADIRFEVTVGGEKSACFVVGKDLNYESFSKQRIAKALEMVLPFCRQKYRRNQH